MAACSRTCSLGEWPWAANDVIGCVESRRSLLNAQNPFAETLQKPRGIDRTYGHLAPDAENYERELLDAFDAKNKAFGQLSGV